MNREAVIEFVLEHYKAENHGRVDYDECFGDHLEGRTTVCWHAWLGMKRRTGWIRFKDQACRTARPRAALTL